MSEDNHSFEILAVDSIDQLDPNAKVMSLCYVLNKEDDKYYSDCSYIYIKRNNGWERMEVLS